MLSFIGFLRVEEEGEEGERRGLLGGGNEVERRGLLGEGEGERDE